MSRAERQRRIRDWHPEPVQLDAAPLPRCAAITHCTLVPPDVLERLVKDECERPDECNDTMLDLCREAVAKNDARNVTRWVEREIAKGRAEIVGGLLSIIMEHPQPDLTAACLALAAGLPTSTETGADIGRRFGIDRSAVGQRVRRLRRKLGLPGSKGE